MQQKFLKEYKKQRVFTKHMLKYMSFKINPLDLPYVDIWNIPLNVKSVVYFVIDGDCVIQYIGKTQGLLKTRFSNHHRMDYFMDLDDPVLAYLTVEKDLLSSVEQAALAYYNPLINSQPDTGWVSELSRLSFLFHMPVLKRPWLFNLYRRELQSRPDKWDLTFKHFVREKLIEGGFTDERLKNEASMRGIPDFIQLRLEIGKYFESLLDKEENKP